MSSPPVFSFPAALAGASSVARVGAAGLVAVLALLASLTIGAGVGVYTGSRSLALTAGGGFMVVALRLVDHLRARPGAPLVTRTLTIERDTLVVEGLVLIPRAQLRSCRYDASTSYVWLRGALAWPILCVEASSIEDAVRLRDALALPDRDIRTFRLPSPLASAAWIGFPIAVLSLGGAMYAVAMLAAAPLRVAIPIALVAFPLFVASFTPARLLVRDDALVRTWLGSRRVVSLLEVVTVSLRGETLVLETRSGTVRWTLRIATSGRAYEWADGARQRGLARHAALVEVIRARTGHAIARTFE